MTVASFPADASSRMIADAIIAALSPEKRPVDNLADRLKEAREDEEKRP